MILKTKSHLFVSPIFENSLIIHGKNSRGIWDKPRRFLICPPAIVIDAADVKPLITGNGIIRTINPSESKPISNHMIPQKKLNAIA
jgi:hypothetical protein